MDENLERAINNCNEAFINFGKAVYEMARELGERMLEALSDMDELNHALSALSTLIDAVIKKTKDRIEERRKWTRVSSVPLKPLFLDRRKAVHHCRNTC